MTQDATTGQVPTLTLGWRLKMALGDMPVQEMCELLGVSRATVSRWMAGKGKAPTRAYIAQWALITRTDFHWLKDGRTSFQPNGGGDGVAGNRATGGRVRLPSRHFPKPGISSTFVLTTLPIAS
jgi:transcriptional regulator with XRE-family HTH domain